MSLTALKISVLIPTRNEASHIAALIEYLRTLPREENCELEIIVCDGDSGDDTRVLAAAAGARVLTCRPNRGAQQNEGARAARGEIFWFLHADARPHRRSLQYLARCARRGKISGGNFRLRFDASAMTDKMWPRVFETIARAGRRRGCYYGDSGIWTRRAVFEQLRGFQEWPLFEDFDLARRLEIFSARYGMRTEYSPLEILASPRRFRNAPARVLAQWLALQMLFQLGVSPQKLARMYFAPKRH
jgi:glycosyltransferase involved in cell wall biosynthesis